MEENVEALPGRRIRAVITLRSGVQIRSTILPDSTMSISENGTLESLKLQADQMISPVSVVGYLDTSEVAAIVFEHYRDREESR